MGYRFLVQLEEFDLKRFCQGEIFSNYQLIKKLLKSNVDLEKRINTFFSGCFNPIKKSMAKEKSKERDHLKTAMIDQQNKFLNPKNEKDRITLNHAIQKLYKKPFHELTVREFFELIVMYLQVGNTGRVQKLVYEFLKDGGTFGDLHGLKVIDHDQLKIEEQYFLEVLNHLRKNESLETLSKLFNFLLFQFVSEGNKELFREDLSPSLNVFYLQDLFLQNPLYNEQLSFMWLNLMVRNIYKPPQSYFKTKKFIFSALIRSPKLYFLFRKLSGRHLNLFNEENLILQKKIRESWNNLPGAGSDLVKSLLYLDSLSSNNSKRIFQYIKSQNQFLLFLIYFSENESQLKQFKKYYFETKN